MNFGGTIRLNRVGICIITGISILILIYLNTNSRYRSTESVKGEPGKGTNINLKKLLIASIEVAELGGKEVFSVRNEPNIDEKVKGKTKEGVKDVVTRADFKSHCIMFYSIAHTFPKLKVISEESFHESECPEVPLLKLDSSNNNILDDISTISDENVAPEDITVWIDPLDATKEYTEKLVQYVTTLVCIAVKGKPVIGVVHKPFSEVPTTYWAWVGKGASKNLKHITKDDAITKVIISLSHAGQAKNTSIQAFGEKNVEVIGAAGAGYKSLELASGNVDVYLHLTEIKKWDICAGNAIISALDGKMTTLSNNDIDYSSKGLSVNAEGVLATMKKHDWFLDKFSSVHSKN